MGKRLIAADLAVTSAEAVALALALAAFYALRPLQTFTGAVILAGPVLGALIYGIILSVRRLNAIAACYGLDAARDAVVDFPRRALVHRTAAVIVIAGALTFGAAFLARVPWPLTLAVWGVVSSTTFAGNVVRALIFRRLLAPRASELFAADPYRYLALTLRERLFVNGNLLGTVGAVAASAYLWLITGVPLWQMAEMMKYISGLAGILTATWTTDLFLRTRPVIAFLAPRGGPGPTSLQGPTSVGRSAAPRQALRTITALPYRLAASFFATWVVAGLVYALDYLFRGGQALDAIQVFAAVVAVAFGLALYQIVLNRRTLAPARERAALELVRSGEAPFRSRLSVSAKLAAAFLIVVVFGGTFAFLTAYAEHERYLASAAALEAVAQRDALWAARHADLVAAAEDTTSDREARLKSLPPGKGDLFVAVGELEGGSLPVGPEGTLMQGASRTSIAWRRVTDRAVFGVVVPWKRIDLGLFGRSALLFVFGALGAATLGVVVLASRELARPIRQLARDAQRIGRGELDEPVPAPDTDELGDLASALETARRDLRSKLDSIAELNASLERKVDERTAELQEANRSLSDALASLENAQEHVVQSEKMASLGRLVAGIAHEINNPLNFIQNSLAPLRRTIRELSHVVDAVTVPSDASANALRKAARNVVEAVRSARVPERLAELEDLMRVMDNGVSRMVQVVRALRDFSRHGTGGEPEAVDLSAAVDSAAALLRHELKGRIRLVTEVSVTPRLWALPGPLGQVLVNLFKNAAQAIDGEGQIRVHSRALDGGVELLIADTGRGMAPDVVSKIFEPFFTTKPQGEGTGLGLAIVHGIVEKHGGRVTVASQVGKGTEFRLFFPDKTAPGTVSSS